MDCMVYQLWFFQPTVIILAWYHGDELIIITIIIKTSSTGPSLRNKVIYKFLSQQHKHLRHEKNEENTTQGSNQQLTAP